MKLRSNPARATRVIRWLVGGCLLAGIASLSGETFERWIAPRVTGDGSGKDRTNAMAFSPNRLQVPLSDPATEACVFHFLPGEYLCAGWFAGHTNKLVVFGGEGARPEDTVIKFADEAQRGRQASIFQATYPYSIRRFVATNLTFDCNFSGQGWRAGPANPERFKNAAIMVMAPTGRIRHVIVRDFGAKAVAPLPLTNASPTEAFPISVRTYDFGQAAEDGDSHPWVIEDCELHGFTSLYDGYCTAIIANAFAYSSNTPPQLRKDPARRVIAVRRNQIRGLGSPAIALGVAGDPTSPDRESGKTLFTDNIILDAYMAFNTDTGGIHDLTFTNNLFLDVGVIGYAGSAFASSGYHSRYDVSGNSVRFAARRLRPNYADFAPLDGRQFTNGPAYAPGRAETNEVVGLSLQGAISDFRFERNRFTTRDRDVFFDANPQRTEEATFRVLRVVESRVRYRDLPAQPRTPPVNLSAGGNQISRTAFDFVNARALPAGRARQWSPDETRELTTERPALKLRTGAPALAGRIGRLEPVFELAAGDSQPHLVGARELVFATPVSAGGRVQLKARLAVQPTPILNSSIGSNTRFLPDQLIGLEVVRGPHAAVKLSARTDASGWADFSYPATEGTNGVDVVRAWASADSSAGAGGWEEYRGTWAEVEVLHGTVLSVKAEPDVAGSRWLHPGRLIFKRTGTSGKKSPLTVRFRFESGEQAAKLDEDFTLGELGGAHWRRSTAEGGVHELTLDSDQAVLEVRPRARTPAKDSVVYVRLLDGAGYAVSAPGSVRVLIYDASTGKSQ